MVADIKPLFTSRQDKETRNRILNYKPHASGVWPRRGTSLRISHLSRSGDRQSWEFLPIENSLLFKFWCVQVNVWVVWTPGLSHPMVSVVTNQRLVSARMWPMRELGDRVSGLDEFLVDWWEHSGMRCYKVRPRVLPLSSDGCWLCHFWPIMAQHLPTLANQN